MRRTSLALRGAALVFVLSSCQAASPVAPCTQGTICQDQPRSIPESGNNEPRIPPDTGAPPTHLPGGLARQG